MNGRRGPKETENDGRTVGKESGAPARLESKKNGSVPGGGRGGAFNYGGGRCFSRARAGRAAAAGKIRAGGGGSFAA